MKCIVGLGNPGSRYFGTRHNIGFRILDCLSTMLDGKVFTHTDDYELYKTEKSDALLLYPLTFMNLSGNAVKRVIEEFTLPLSDILIVYDDFQLPFGTVRMRSHGSDGGHNGMASIIYSLEADEIPRLRIGIGGKELPIDHSHDAMAEYVLSPFSAEEEKELPLFCDFAAHACSSWLDQGINKTMSMFNKKFFSDPKIGS